MTTGGFMGSGSNLWDWRRGTGVSWPTGVGGAAAQQATRKAPARNPFTDEEEEGGSRYAPQSFGGRLYIFDKQTGDIVPALGVDGMPIEMATGGALNLEFREVGGALYALNPRTGEATEIIGAPAQQEEYDFVTDRRSGQTIRIDKRTGQPAGMIGAFDWPTVSPEIEYQRRQQEAAERRRYGAQENEAQRRYQSGESAIERAARAQEAGAQRGFQAGESALERAQRAGEFAADYGMRTREQALSGARQYADLSSSFDPGALPAFYQAGGGNAMNAISRGATALSREALAPGAFTLQAMNSAPPVNPFAYSAAGLVPDPRTRQVEYPGGGVADYSNLTPEERAAMQARMDAQYEGVLGAARAGHYGSTAFNVGDEEALARAGFRTAGARLRGPAPEGVSFEQTDAGTFYRAAGAPPSGSAQAIAQSPPGGQGVPTAVWNPETNNLDVVYRGRGGMVSGGAAIVGDDPRGRGRENREMVMSHTPGAVFSVQPMRQLGTGGFIVGQGSGGFAPGGRNPYPDVSNPYPDLELPLPGGATGGASGAPPVDPNRVGGAELDPYIERVRAQREGTDVRPPLAGGIFNVAWGRTAPSLQQRYLLGLQRRYGIPAMDLQAEAQRYAVPGVSRGAFALQG